MAQSASAVRTNFSRRSINIIIATATGMAVGLIFVIWNIIGGAGYEVVNVLTPGLGGLVVGMWFLGGPLGAYIIRKPGAATLVEAIAAMVSTLIGNQWGITTLCSGLAQGLGAELVLLTPAYKNYNLTTVVTSGFTVGIGAWTFELFTGDLTKTFGFNVIYLISSALSGVVLAGLLAYFLAKALAVTGVSDRFAIGRERHDDV